MNTSRLSENGKPFEARITIPRLLIRAKYSSSGVLLIIPASGAGDFDGVLGRPEQRKRCYVFSADCATCNWIFADGVTADLKGTVSNEKRETGTHMHVDSLTLELNVKKVRMHIAKVFKNNRILSKFESRRCLFAIGNS